MNLPKIKIFKTTEIPVKSGTLAGTHEVFINHTVVTGLTNQGKILFGSVGALAVAGFAMGISSLAKK